MTLNTQIGDKGDAERNILASYYTECKKQERILIRNFKANKHIKPTIKASDLQLSQEVKDQLMLEKEEKSTGKQFSNIL